MLQLPVDSKPPGGAPGWEAVMDRSGLPRTGSLILSASKHRRAVFIGLNEAPPPTLCPDLMMIMMINELIDC